MTTHDPLCLYYGERNEGDCTMCGVIATVRVHERERIAAEAEDFIKVVYPDGPRSPGVVLHKWIAVKEIAARIARHGGVS